MEGRAPRHFWRGRGQGYPPPGLPLSNVYPHLLESPLDLNEFRMQQGGRFTDPGQVLNFDISIAGSRSRFNTLSHTLAPRAAENQRFRAFQTSHATKTPSTSQRRRRSISHQPLQTKTQAPMPSGTAS